MATIHRTTSKRKQPRPSKIRPPAKVRPRVKRGSAVGATTVAALRERLSLKQNDFSRLLNVSVRSLATLEQGSAPSESVSRRLTEMTRLTDALSEVINAGALNKWLTTPNESFDELKPLEVIERGESDRLWSMIYFLRSGAPS